MSQDSTARLHSQGGSSSVGDFTPSKSKDVSRDMSEDISFGRLAASGEFDDDGNRSHSDDDFDQLAGDGHDHDRGAPALVEHRGDSAQAAQVDESPVKHELSAADTARSFPPLPILGDTLPAVSQETLIGLRKMPISNQMYKTDTGVDGGPCHDGEAQAASTPDITGASSVLADNSANAVNGTSEPQKTEAFGNNEEKQCGLNMTADRVTPLRAGHRGHQPRGRGARGSSRGRRSGPRYGGVTKE